MSKEMEGYKEKHCDMDKHDSSIASLLINLISWMYKIASSINTLQNGWLSTKLWKMHLDIQRNVKNLSNSNNTCFHVNAYQLS